MQGYYRFPTIHGNTIIFVSEDDLWTVPVEGGIARRLTSNLGQVMHPYISPDGKHVAFTGQEEGHPEVYCMPAQGGPAQRLTYLGGLSYAVGWTPDSKRILFASNTGQWYFRTLYVYSVHHEKDIPRRVMVGPATQISFAPRKGVVIGRNTADPARWKRYRGGTAGELWIDRQGNGSFRKLIDLKGNIASPMWIGKHIYFISDHQGVGNIYSCTPDGKNLKRHTDHTNFYVRHAKTDGKNITYQAGGEIFVYSPRTRNANKINMRYHSPRVQTNRKFVNASQYIEDYTIHPCGQMVTLTTRGKVFTMPTWEGPVSQNGGKANTRYRLGRWLNDAKRLVVVTDEKGEDTLQIHHVDSVKAQVNLPVLDIGRPIELEPSPLKPLVAMTNHRNELILVDLNKKKRVILDRSKYHRISGITWSPDGNWLAYSYPDTQRTACIKMCNTQTRKSYPVTRTVMTDFSPSFDPEGKYLYFLSNRHFDPVYDTIQFELSFPANIKPYLITLTKDIPSPFRYTRIAPAGLEFAAIERALRKAQKPAKAKKLKIDITGIQSRIVPIPLPPANYTQICGIKDKILITEFPIQGGKELWLHEEAQPKGTIKFYDLNDQKSGSIASGVIDFKMSRSSEILIYRGKNRLRVTKPMEGLDEKLKKEPAGPKSGWLDLSRIKVMVEPVHEWHQMYDDVWRLQRDHFWTKDMSGVDWKKVYKRYLPLLERIGTRSEFSDLTWEMQGELGTSHAYEWGGDYRQEPQYRQGFLGADFEYSPQHKAYRIKNIVQGDPWDQAATSPLLAPGLNAREGDLLLAIDGKRLDKNTLPQELLVNRAGADVSITIASSRGRSKRTVSLKTLRSEAAARYRDWVEKNRATVHRLSKNQIGYVHIPDMGPEGFAEFHRYYLNELQYPAMIVDVRFNRGGHVSPLILEKLARKRIGYDITRWGQPEAYPYESVLGPIVCLTDEHAGSDGDIFSHAFKLKNIGPLIGKRTWGGVVGISPYYNLSDGGLTTQPEYSFWFMDVGWGVENYGTDPDIVVENRPQDYARKKDAQLERGLKEGLNLLKKHPPKIPKFGKKPKKPLPDKLR